MGQDGNPFSAWYEHFGALANWGHVEEGHQRHHRDPAGWRFVWGPPRGRHWPGPFCLDIAHGLVSKNVGWLGLFTLVEQQRGPATAPISLLFARRERAAIAGTCNDVVIVATHPVVVAAATFVSSAVC